MGGLKRKIDTGKKIEDKNPRAVAHSKRCKGLFRKASEFCRLSDDSQLAIIATPVSSNSNASFYSFGYSSVDGVVEAFLADHRDDDEKLGFWWEDESLANSDNPEELRNALGYMTRMLHDLKQHHVSSSPLRVRQDNVVVPNCAEEQQNLDHGCDLVLDDDFDIEKIYELLSSSEFASTMDEELQNKQSGCVDVKKEKGVSLVTHQQQNLNGSSGDQVDDFDIDQIYDLLTNSEFPSMDDVFHNNSEEEQTLAVSEFPSIDDVLFLNNSEAV